MEKPAPKGIRKRFSLKYLPLLAIGLLVLLLSFRYAGFSETSSTLSAADLNFLLLFIFARILVYGLSTYKWKVFVDKIQKTSLSIIAPIFFSGMILDNLIPGPGFGGEPVKAYYLGRAIKKSFSKCFATALMDSIAYLAVFLGFLAAAVIYVFLYVRIPLIRNLLEILIAILVLGGIATYYFSRKADHIVLDKILNWIYHFKPFKIVRERFLEYDQFKEFIARHFSEFLSTLKSLWATKSIFFYTVFLSFLLILLEIWSVQLLLKSFGLEISFVQVLVVVIISGFIGYYSMIPSGTGAVEGSMILLLSFVGIPPGVSGAVTLISRVSFYLITYGLGYMSLVYVGLKYKS